jgi:hypothetical protein
LVYFSSFWYVEARKIWQPFEPILIVHTSLCIDTTFSSALRHGTNLLAKYGWCSLRCGRDEKWPVLEDWFCRFRSTSLSAKFDADAAFFDDDFADVDESARRAEGEWTVPSCFVDRPSKSRH